MWTIFFGSNCFILAGQSPVIFSNVSWVRMRHCEWAIVITVANQTFKMCYCSLFYSYQEQFLSQSQQHWMTSLCHRCENRNSYWCCTETPNTFDTTFTRINGDVSVSGLLNNVQKRALKTCISAQKQQSEKRLLTHESSLQGFHCERERQSFYAFTLQTSGFLMSWSSALVDPGLEGRSRLTYWMLLSFCGEQPASFGSISIVRVRIRDRARSGG